MLQHAKLQPSVHLSSIILSRICLILLKKYLFTGVCGIKHLIISSLKVFEISVFGVTKQVLMRWIFFNIPNSSSHNLALGLLSL
jgi:hypothetical protein